MIPSRLLRSQLRNEADIVHIQEQNAIEVENFSHREPLLFSPAHTMKNADSTYALRTQQYKVSGFRPNDVGLAQHAMEVQLRLGVLRRQTRQGHRVLRNNK